MCFLWGWHSTPTESGSLSFYLAPKSLNGGSMVLAPARRHCSMFSLISLMISDGSTLLSPKIQLFLAHHSSQVVAMIMVLTPFFPSLSVQEMILLIVDGVCIWSLPGGRSLGGGGREAQPLHFATSTQTAYESWKF